MYIGHKKRKAFKIRLQWLRDAGSVTIDESKCVPFKTWRDTCYIVGKALCQTEVLILSWKKNGLIFRIYQCFEPNVEFVVLSGNGHAVLVNSIQFDKKVLHHLRCSGRRQ